MPSQLEKTESIVDEMLRFADGVGWMRTVVEIPGDDYDDIIGYAISDILPNGKIVTGGVYREDCADVEIESNADGWIYLTIDGVGYEPLEHGWSVYSNFWDGKLDRLAE